MKVLILFISIICLTSMHVFAQESDDLEERIKFSSIQQVGIIAHNQESHPTFQLIIGAKYKRLFAGLGAGVDSYFANSFPAFFDARFTFIQKRLHAFTYGDIGINKLFHSANRFPAYWREGERAYSLHPGLYYEYGLGIKTMLTKNLAYTLSCGVTFKETKYTQYAYWSIEQEPFTELYRNVASRFAVRMGLQF